MLLDFICRTWNIDGRLHQRALAASALIKDKERELEEIAGTNQARILKIFQEEQVGEGDFYPSTGYGYNDLGRDKLERIWAKVFGAQEALVRHQIVSGTHAITLCLSSILRPGDELLSAVGSPYDTLRTVIGHREKIPGSLYDWGISYREVPLLPGGVPDLKALAQSINGKTRMVLVQRSRGYSWRPALSLDQIGAIVGVVKEINPKIVCLVDNCYGEFTAVEEPPSVGADLVAGSLIKNPGGGLAPCGGYIAGKKGLVGLAAARLTAPGLGRELGASLDLKRLLYQGLFLAPHVVGEALAGTLFAAQIFEDLGFEVSPRVWEDRPDLIQAVRFNGPEELVAFCQGIQRAAPVDSMVTPVPAPMPGYNHQVIMACGSFVQGASIEMSADAPLREPYIAYLQGGLTGAQVKISVMIALQYMLEQGGLKI